MKLSLKIMALLAIIAILVSVGRAGRNVRRNAFKAEFARREESKKQSPAVAALLREGEYDSVLRPLTEAFTPMPAGWGSFSVHKNTSPEMRVDRQDGERVVSFENGDIVVSLDYADPPSDEGQAEQDTKKVVGVILDILLSQPARERRWLRDLGEAPREQWTKVLVFAQKSDAGEVYGESSYYFQEEDLVKWVKYDPERDGPAEKWIETRSE